MARIKTGNLRLDNVLHGGFLENSINIISGLPGTGKTIMAQEIIFSNASNEKKALYLGTASEPLDKIIFYLQGFKFFKPELINDAIIYEDLSQVLRSEGLAGTVERIKQLVKEHRPSFLVIDSFKAFHSFIEKTEEFRRYLTEIATLLSSLSVTAFWVGEYSVEAQTDLPEFAVADGIIELITIKIGVKDARYLRVIKMRGTGFYSGEHAYKITDSGLDVFPRLTTPKLPADYELKYKRSTTGVEVLDKMTEGFWKGSSTVTFGPPGSGKTLIGLHFIFKGIENGEKGIIATLQENPTQIARIASGFGWDLKKAIKDGMLELMYVSPIDVYIDEFMIKLSEQADKFGTERILLDSLNDLQISSPSPERFRDFMYALVQNMTVKGISLFMTQEIKDLFGTSVISEYGISHISDNVFLLNYVREESKVKRAITVIKTRAARHDESIRQFQITKEGIKVGKAFSKQTYGLR